MDSWQNLPEILHYVSGRGEDLRWSHIVFYLSLGVITNIVRGFEIMNPNILSMVVSI
jgi:hypothetical protein